MQVLQQGIITLIRSALNQQKMTLPQDFSLDEAIDLINKHHIQALCFEGATLCGIPMGSSPMQKLFHAYCNFAIVANRQDKAIEKLFKTLEDNGIDYIPLKGSRMRPLYPKPELRTMGDADILIRLEQYEAIVPLVLSLGYRYHSQTDHDYCWTSKDLFLELHHMLLAPDEVAFTPMQADGWSVAHPVIGCRWGMRIEDEWLYQFGHFTKHYSDGIGIRHVADLWMFLKHHPQMDESYITQQLRKLRMEEFYSNVMGLIKLWFEDGPSNETLAFMNDYIFACGSWGTTQTHQLNDVVKGTTKNESIPRQFWRKLIKFLFPGREAVEQTFPVAAKHRWLYVPLLLARPVYRLFKERNIGKIWARTAKSYDTARVDEKRRQLELVGLHTQQQTDECVH